MDKDLAEIKRWNDRRNRGTWPIYERIDTVSFFFLSWWFCHNIHNFALFTMEFFRQPIPWLMFYTSCQKSRSVSKSFSKNKDNVAEKNGREFPDNFDSSIRYCKVGKYLFWLSTMLGSGLDCFCLAIRVRFFFRFLWFGESAEFSHTKIFTLFFCYKELEKLAVLKLKAYVQFPFSFRVILLFLNSIQLICFSFLLIMGTYGPMEKSRKWMGRKTVWNCKKIRSLDFDELSWPNKEEFYLMYLFTLKPLLLVLI